MANTQSYNPATGEWNDSLTGNFLWSSVNVSEAVPDVMTPSTWSLWQIYHHDFNPIKIPGNYPICGNICGRPYLNLSLVVSLYRAVGKDIRQELHGDLIGSAPAGLNIPIVPFSTLAVIWTVLPGMITAQRYAWRDQRRLSDFVAATPGWCRNTLAMIDQSKDTLTLASLWRETIRPCFLRACWLLRSVTMAFSDSATKLRLDLTGLAGEADANTIMSNLAGKSADLESLGPLVGLARVRRNEMSRAAYLEHYSHRGPHEMELFAPGSEEDSDWLDKRLVAFDQATANVDTLLQNQRAKYEAAWQRFTIRFPRKANRFRRQLDRVAVASRAREAVRSEVTRLTRLVRQFALRAGALTFLGEGIFFLSLDEMIAVCSGDETAAVFIPARRATFYRYGELPPYPAIIVGHFDPFLWATDPNRRSDYFDSRARAAAPATIKGFAGAAGRVEGIVRRLESPEEGDLLQPGEILVTVTTNVGWTPLFPRAAAIITDVGAPLSHAAIVARELGIPAVVGCGNATACLKTGDRVLVDGGQGIVSILDSKEKS